MPAALAALSFGYGVAFGVLKIAWIVLAAVYLYDISVETGQFEIMKESVAELRPTVAYKFCSSHFVSERLSKAQPASALQSPLLARS